MFLTLEDLQHLNSITHEGKVLVFAVNSSGNIFYTVRQDGFEDNYGKTVLPGWEDRNALSLPDLADDPSVTEQERKDLFWETAPGEGSFILHSIYKGRGQSAAVPIQLVSALGYVYVFRQSPWNSIFADRFVLDGMSNKLIPKLDIRFKASRQKYKPLEASQANGLLQADSLDFRDANGNYFYEPTLELTQVGSVQDGMFAVVLLPTADHDRYRWHFFKATYQQVEIVSIRASEEGLFDVRDELQLLPGSGPQGMDAWMEAPGILRRTISLGNLTVTGALAATKYDLQMERNTQAGPQLLRGATRVMLAVPTNQGVVTLSFAAALDGTLSMIEESPDETILLVNRAKDILLPINTLDQIQAVGSSTPLPQGTITGMARGDGDRVTIFTDNSKTLKLGDTIEIGGTAGYDGHYIVTATNNGAFEIQVPFSGSEIGHWQAVPDEQELTFDGMITAYEITTDGKLRVHAANHGLQPGDEVQIVDTRDYNGTYQVQWSLGTSFSLDIPWQPGKEMNLKLESRKRRGIALDGQADYLETTGLNLTRLSKLDSGGETISAWVYVNTPASGKEQLVAGRKDGLMELVITPGGQGALRVQFADGPVTIADSHPVPAQQWTHFAASFAYDPQTLDTTLRLCRNGNMVREGLARELAAEKAASYSLALDGQDDYVDLLNPQALNIAGRITLEAWVMPKTLDGEQVILAHGGSKDSTDSGVFLCLKDGIYQVGTTDGNEQAASAVAASIAADPGDAGYWVHLAGVYDGTAWRLYKDRREDKALETKSGASKSSAAWAIGAWGSGKAGFFTGLIDEARIWRTARSAEEIQATAGKRLLGNEPGLAGYWTFTQLQSQLRPDGTLPEKDLQVEDGSRQKNLGTVHGGPRMESGAALQAANAPESRTTWMADLWIGGALTNDGSASDPTMQRYFGGQLADLQVWDVERTARDIENSMYLQLLGRETGLAGYWRLESITAGTPRTTTDFSVYGRDATVHGSAYVGARSLSRKLGDNTTPAVQYINEEYFSVTQRATYIETFEFKVTPNLDPNQADQDGKPLFAFTYWGKASQGAAELIPFNGQTHQFEPALESGWYQATGTFTVPDGVSLVRTFGIGDVRGSWDQLDVRRHHIRMVSGSITETHYNENLVLDTLGAPQEVLEGYLKSLAQKELEEPALIAEKLQLESQIASLNIDSQTLQAQIDAARSDVSTLTAARNTQFNLYRYEVQNPLNYPVHMMTLFTGPTRILTLRQDGGVQFIDQNTAEQGGAQTWYFELRPDGYYSIRKSGVPGMSLGVNPASWIVLLAPDAGVDSQAWQVGYVGGYYRLTTKQWGNAKALDVDPRTLLARLADSGNYSGQDWDLGIWGAPINNRVSNAQAYFNNADSGLNGAQQRLTTLLKIQQDGQALKNQWQQRLREVIAALTGLQTQMAGLRDSYLRAYTAPGPLSLPDLQTDSRNLTTSGALLGFVHSGSGLSLLETSEGNVQLSYFDMAGRMRQTLYDATSDSSRNDTYQVWLQDALRVGLNFEPGGRMMPNHPVTPGEAWTLESWFSYPLANAGVVASLPNQPDTSWMPLEANTLVGGAGGDRHVTVRGGILGSMQGGEFWPSGFTMNQLTHGWHHLAVVGSGTGKASTTRFYIDGNLVGDTKAVQMKPVQDQIESLRDQLAKLKQPGSQDQVDCLNKQIASAQANLEDISNKPFKIKSDIRTIGNTNIDPPSSGDNAPAPQPEDEPFGKIAELRIHQTALSAEEVEINSKLTLSGNEPGLAVYYRMNEAAGTTARNSARPVDDMAARSSPPAGADGGPYDAALQNKVSWWPCAAPIGNPGHTVMGFDGLDDNIVAPASNLPSQTNVFSVEAWFRTNAIRQDPNAFQGILAWGSTSDANGGFWLRLGSEGIQLNGMTVPVDGLTGVWHHVAVIFNGTYRFLYLDGVYQRQDVLALSIQPAQEVRIGWTRNRPNSELIEDPFDGAITEVRLWDRQLSERELREHMRVRLAGGMEKPVVYFPLKETDPQMRMNGANIRTDNALPLAGSAVISAEYSTLGTDATGRQTAMMRRFLACPAQNGVHLLAGKRVEALERVWIGNTQFQPTLLGFIEGAPPVPSENLTARDDYSSATQAELVVSDDMAYSWRREQDAGLGAKLSMFLGVDAQQFIVEAPLGVGVITTGASQHFGGKDELTMGYSFLNNSTISTASSSSSSDRIVLTGTQEPRIKFEALGRRFIPKNIGYALVVSGLADVYILRLQRTGKMIAYQVLPNPDIPMDVNTITFLINPAYTMNGSLDGQTGSHAASDRFYRNVPEMRARYGSRYPASYFRIQEAYQLKQAIANQDKQRASYFENFNSLLVDEASVSRNIDVPSQMPSSSEADARKKEIEKKIQDQEQMVHAQASFAAWQRKMEDLQVKAGKRNIVNTYVWDSDGGLRAESQAFANTVEHTVGGSFSMDGAFGVEANLDVLGLDLQLTAQATVHITQTMTKTQNSSRGFALNVDLSGLENTGITDYNGLPILPGEKVSRYRMMSFYLEGSTDHFVTFFNEVVDPEWLQSNSEEARALRQVQAGKPNKTWRVLHRVTYVERPTLMGFGQDTRKLIQSQDGAATLDSIQMGISQLQAAGQKLQTEFDNLMGDLSTLGSAGLALKQQFDDMQKTLHDIQQALATKQSMPGGTNK